MYSVGETFIGKLDFIMLCEIEANYEVGVGVETNIEAVFSKLT